MHFSLSSEYAIHGLVYLAINSPGEVTMLADVSVALKVPESTFRKVFQTLARSGIVKAYRGAKGGYSLGRPPGEITFRDIVEAVEGGSPIYRCLGIRRSCELGSNGCPINSAFVVIQERVYSALEQVTLQEVIDDVGSQHMRIQWLAMNPKRCRVAYQSHDTQDQ